jgi:hypothetical protein
MACYKIKIGNELSPDKYSEEGLRKIFDDTNLSQYGSSINEKLIAELNMTSLFKGMAFGLVGKGIDSTSSYKIMGYKENTLEDKIESYRKSKFLSLNEVYTLGSETEIKARENIKKYFANSNMITQNNISTKGVSQNARFIFQNNRNNYDLAIVPNKDAVATSWIIERDYGIKTRLVVYDKDNVKIVAIPDNNLRYSLEVVKDDVRELFNLLNNSESENEKTIEAEKTKIENQVLRSLYQNKIDNDYVYDKEQKFTYATSLTEEELRSKIRQDIIPLKFAFGEQEKDLFVNFINRIAEIDKSELDIKELTKEVFGDKRFSERTIKELLTVLGVNLNVYKAMKYSDLEKSTDARFRALYNKNMKGFNPLVIIHNIDSDGHIDLSLIDISTKHIFERNDAAEFNKNIISIVASDSKYKALGGTLNNSNGDIRNLLLTLTMMNMQSNMIANNESKIKIRNIGVVSPSYKLIQSRMITELSMMVEQVKILKKFPVFLNLIKNEAILATINNDTLYNIKYKQNYFAILTNHIKDLSTDSSLTDARRAFELKQYNILTRDDISNRDITKVLINRMRYLEKLMSLEEVYKNEEYQLLARAVMEKTSGFTELYNKVEDMGSMQKYFQSAHMISDSILQWFRDNYIKSNNEIIFKTKEAIKKLRKDELIDKVIKGSVNRSTIGKYVSDQGSNTFQHLFKTVEASKGIGKEVKKIFIPYIHWDKSNLDTKNEIGKTLTEDDLKFANLFLDLLEERYIDNILHNESLNNKVERTREDALNILKSSGYERGYIPVMDKTINELLVSGHISDSIKKYFKVTGNSSELIEEDINRNNDNYQNIFAKLGNQVNHAEILSRAGLNVEYDKGSDKPRYIIKDNYLNEVMSLDLEKIHGMFMLSSIRKEIIENKIIPIYNATLSIMEMYPHTDLLNNKEYLEAYLKRNVFKQDKDEKLNLNLPSIVFKQKVAADGQIIQPGFQIGGGMNLSQFGKSMIHSSSSWILAYNIKSAIKSAVFNNIALFTNSLSATLSGASKSNIAMPGITHINEAMIRMANVMIGDTKDFELIYKLGKRYNLILSQDKDLIDNPRMTKVNKNNIFQTYYMHLMNQAGDEMARVISMAAIMIKDDSYKAFSIDKQTGEVIYDKTKDGRYYDTNGKAKTKNGEHVLLESLRQRLIEEGQQDETEKNPILGYSFEESDGSFKWYADKFIIGAMDPTNKAFLGSMFLGMMISQFQTFMLTRLENLGIFAGTRNTTKGVGYRAIKDEDGNWITEKEIIKIEGMLQSVTKLANKLIYGGDLDTMTKFNLAKMSIQTTMLTLIAIFFFAGSDDEDKKKKLISVLWEYGKDLTPGPTALQLSMNPFTVFSIYGRMFKSIGTGDMEKVARQFGLTRNYYNIEEIFKTE